MIEIDNPNDEFKAERKRIKNLLSNKFETVMENQGICTLGIYHVPCVPYLKNNYQRFLLNDHIPLNGNWFQYYRFIHTGK